MLLPDKRSQIVKLRSHQLGQKYFTVCGIWGFPDYDPKSRSSLMFCYHFSTPKIEGAAIGIVVILPVVVKQQQYSGSQWS